MAGQGQLWVGADGLPARINVTMDFYNTSFNWPDGDAAGQIQDPAQMTRARNYGQPLENDPGADVYVIPMLEIKMTGDNLPLPHTVPTVTLTANWGSVSLQQTGDDTQLTYHSGPALNSLALYKETCANRADNAGLTVTNLSAGTQQTLAGQTLLTQIADGNHVLLAASAEWEDGPKCLPSATCPTSLTPTGCLT